MWSKRVLFGATAVAVFVVSMFVARNVYSLDVAMLCLYPFWVGSALGERALGHKIANTLIATMLGYMFYAGVGSSHPLIIPWSAGILAIYVIDLAAGRCLSYARWGWSNRDSLQNPSEHR